MGCAFNLTRIVLLAAALLSATAIAHAQDKPVTPPDSYRVVMENDRVRMIEVNIGPHSKVNVDSPADRERFLYMLTDGALILAPPGKTPYEFALHAGETAVFPAVSPTVENDTDSPVRALMVEVKAPARAVASSRAKGRHVAKARSRGKSAAGSRSKPRRSAKGRKSKAAPARKNTALQPLNLRKANSRPAKKVKGKAKSG